MRDLRVMSIGRATRPLHCVMQWSRCRAEPKADCSEGAVWRREAREEAPPGIVVATDTASADADHDNGTDAVYNTPRPRRRDDRAGHRIEERGPREGGGRMRQPSRGPRF